MPKEELESSEFKSKLVSELNSHDTLKNVLKKLGINRKELDIAIEFHIPDYDLSKRQGKIHSYKLRSGEVKTWFKDPEMQKKLNPFKDPEWQRQHHLWLKKNQISCLYNHDQRGNGFGIRSEHYSSKMGIQISCRSRWEKELMERLDSDLNVVAYLYEPCVIKYGDHKYHPDFLIWTRDNFVYLIELKPKFRLHEITEEQKHNAVIDYCERKNLKFQIWTELELGREKLPI